MLNLAEKYWSWLSKRKAEAPRKLKFIKYKRKAWGKSQNNTPCKETDRLFEVCIDSGVVKSETKPHLCEAEFSNGWKVSFWNSNKMYAYCDTGQFVKPDGTKITIKGPPSMYMCYYILEKVENFNLEK